MDPKLQVFSLLFPDDFENRTLLAEVKAFNWNFDKWGKIKFGGFVVKSCLGSVMSIRPLRRGLLDGDGSNFEDVRFTFFALAILVAAAM